MLLNLYLPSQTYNSLTTLVMQFKIVLINLVKKILRYFSYELSYQISIYNTFIHIFYTNSEKNLLVKQKTRRKLKHHRFYVNSNNSYKSTIVNTLTIAIQSSVKYTLKETKHIIQQPPLIVQKGLLTQYLANKSICNHCQKVLLNISSHVITIKNGLHTQRNLTPKPTSFFCHKVQIHRLMITKTPIFKTHFLVIYKYLLHQQYQPNTHTKTSVTILNVQIKKLLFCFNINLQILIKIKIIKTLSIASDTSIVLVPLQL
eukprot:TRINITY_DN4638_c0_g1_i11.p1 TRINITY_DN4638_c0_g1~~TRINITY_DN4638_c0_g1_i11.p1  ORF type:complete len:259 (+),score=-30.01 TRINITY_DN4638_c0_g1_i11:83-859(+)